MGKKDKQPNKKIFSPLTLMYENCLDFVRQYDKNNASVMVLWYSSFGIPKNARLCYSCIMVDLNCGHRINQEVKVWF